MAGNTSTPYAKFFSKTTHTDEKMTPATPQISVIVPVYNTQKYLPQCIDSLLGQTLEHIEIILVDDGSTDSSPAICDRYAEHDRRVKVIHKKNAGQGYARNSGLEAATGEYITFVDSDDCVDPTAYRQLCTMAGNAQADILYFSYRRFNDRGETWNATHVRNKKQYCLTPEDIRKLTLDMVANPPECSNIRDIECSVCVAIYRHSTIKKHGIKFKSERELHSEDLLFNLDCIMHSSTVVAIPDVFYNYRANPSSFSLTANSSRINRDYRYYRHLLETMQANRFGTEGYLRATRYFIDDTTSSMRLYVQSSLSESEKIQLIQETASHHSWPQIAASYPYRKLPLRHMLAFHLMYKRRCRLLYRYLKLFNTAKQLSIRFKNTIGR
ncbi:MAG: glycosyltransferase [Bacteroidales bacterium]|jgi:glycosyltransferase involved in cell wall biosynthesis|nr:glycosyltransferase [Bacteroidales bacterium]